MAACTCWTGTSGRRRADYPEPPHARIVDLAAGHHEGHPDFGAALHFHTVETGCGHADHSQRLLIHQDLGAQDPGIGAVLVAPEIVAEHGDGVGAGGAVVVFSEQASDGGGYAQHGEVVAGDELALGELPSGARTRRKAGLGDAGAGDDAGEEIGAFGDLLE